MTRGARLCIHDTLRRVLFDAMPLLLHTDRLTVRPFTAGDGDACAKISRACFDTPPDKEWLVWTQCNYWVFERLRQPPYGDYAVERGGVVVGAVGFVPCLAPFGCVPWFDARGISGERFTAEVGLFWAVLPEHRGQGVATEAAGALAAFAWDTLRLDRLVAMTDHDNTASAAVMRRLGMTVGRAERSPVPWLQVVGVLRHDSFQEKR